MAGISLGGPGIRAKTPLPTQSTSPMAAYGGGGVPAMGGGGLLPTPSQPSQTSRTLGGQVVTTNPGAMGGYSIGGGGMELSPMSGGGSIQVTDPDQQRRSRDLADYGNKLNLDQQYGLIGGAGGGAGGGSSSGGGGGDAGAAPPLSKEDIFGVLDKLKGDTPGREAAPAAQPRIAAPAPASQAPSASLGFAQAKDQSGRIGNAALRALKDQMTERGISGSGIEGQLTGGILGDVARSQSDSNFQQQRQSEQQAWEGQQMGYQGDITQRAQDLGLSSAGFQGGIQQRGQDIGANNMLSMAPTILSLLARQRY